MNAVVETRLDISLAALQRQDPYINNIVDVASQVALYTYNNRANEWEKTEVEGTLFIYTRLASPRHGFTIMNRLSMENLTEPITKDLDFQLQDPFLLYRNARCKENDTWKNVQIINYALPIQNIFISEVLNYIKFKTHSEFILKIKVFCAWEMRDCCSV
uniref:5'-(N(7)-methylguanosine 5'-triphospho)-[mRNA] hydrolase n=1 Tax=Sphaeramia orbicularis TaxID=375764 RepID=A0A673A1B8_9TELE